MIITIYNYTQFTIIYVVPSIDIPLFHVHFERMHSLEALLQKSALNSKIFLFDLSFEADHRPIFPFAFPLAAACVTLLIFDILFLIQTDRGGQKKQKITLRPTSIFQGSRVTGSWTSKISDFQKFITPENKNEIGHKLGQWWFVMVSTCVQTFVYFGSQDQELLHFKIYERIDSA